MVRFELEAGDPTRLFALALELLRTIPMRLSSHSLEERAWMQLDETLRKPRKAARIFLKMQLSKVDAERLIAANCLEQIQSNEAGFLGDSAPEFLHQIRVGWRRIRAASSLPDSALWRDLPGLLRAEMRWIWNLLGAARDWDVFVNELLPDIARASATNRHRTEMFAALREHCERMRGRHVDRARAAIRSPRYQRLLLNVAWIIMDSHAAASQGIAALPGDSAMEFAVAALTRRRRKLRKCLRPALLGTATERHRARIAAKKLRYAGDFFRDLFPEKPARRYLERLESIQDALGRLNDLAKGAALVADIYVASELQVSRITRARVAEWLALEEENALAAISTALRRFERIDPYWAAGMLSERPDVCGPDLSAAAKRSR